MSEPFVFDSRCTYCKEPYGAVKCGTEISFRCRPLASAGFISCTLETHREFSGHSIDYPMPFTKIEGERSCFAVTIPAPETPELMWYAFRLQKPDGTVTRAEFIKMLDEKGYEWKDYGCYTTESVDYPDYAHAVAHAVADGVAEKGILICGTGIGISIAANKVKGIRCAHCHDVL